MPDEKIASLQTQMAVFMLGQHSGGLSRAKLFSLLYLADREAIRCTACPISGDDVVALQQGPGLLSLMPMLLGRKWDRGGGWREWINDSDPVLLRLHRKYDVGALTLMSQSDLEILNTIWLMFGALGDRDIRSMLRKNCAEWIAPEGDLAIIPFDTVAFCMGFSKTVSTEIANQIMVEREIDKQFASQHL